MRERVEAEVPADQRPPEAEFEQFIAAQQEGTVAPSFRAFLAFDPRPYLEQLDVPTLALLEEYGAIDVTIDEAVLDAIAGWAAARFVDR